MAETALKTSMRNFSVREAYRADWFPEFLCNLVQGSPNNGPRAKSNCEPILSGLRSYFIRLQKHFINT